MSHTQIYQGSCHCGAIRYSMELDLSQGTTQCNCTWCRKSGWWATQVKPEAFRTQYEESDEAHANGVICPECHMLVYRRGDLPELGGAFVSINVRTLDDVDLQGVPIVYLDELHDTWAFLGSSLYESPF